MSAAAIDYDALAQKHGGAAAVDYDALATKHGGSLMSEAAAPESKGWLDKDIPNTDYGAATEIGVQSIARGVRDAAVGAYNTVRHPIDTLKGVASLPGQVAQVPQAIHEINQGQDPLGTYAQVAQDTAGQGAGQAILAAATSGAAKAPGAIRAALPAAKLANAGEMFQDVSGVIGKHPVTITPGLSDSLMEYHQLVENGGSRSMAVSKLLNRITDPTKGPLTYEDARQFQSNISRLSADEAQRLTPVMKRQVGKISAQLSGAVEDTAANAGQLEKFQGAMKEYAAAKNLEDKIAVLKKYGIRAGLAGLGGGITAAGAKLALDLYHE